MEVGDFICDAYAWARGFDIEAHFAEWRTTEPAYAEVLAMTNLYCDATKPPKTCEIACQTEFCEALLEAAQEAQAAPPGRPPPTERPFPSGRTAPQRSNGPKRECT